MTERNKLSYQFNQDNKKYILLTSLINDKLKLVFQDYSNSQIFEGEFTIKDLVNLGKYFQMTHTIDQIQSYLNGIIENQRIGIEQRDSAVVLIIYLINNDKIQIPLNKKLTSKNKNNKNKNYNNYQNQINNSNNRINEEIRKLHLLETENKNYKIQIEQLNIENEILRENNKRIKELEIPIKYKEEELKKKDEQILSLNLKIQQLNKMLNYNNNKDKIIELMEKLELKENEIKEIKSRYPFELFKGEKLMSVIFQTHDLKFTHSFLCKNTDQFTKLESLLYKEYPEYLENEGENYFLVNGRKIFRYKSLEENGIHNSDIIILNKIIV